MLGSLNNWNIVQFTNKITSGEDFDEIHKVLLDIIGDNTASLVQLSKYGARNASDPTTMVYYVIKYIYEPYIPQEYQTTYGKVLKAGELVVKAQ